MVDKYVSKSLSSPILLAFVFPIQIVLTGLSQYDSLDLFLDTFLAYDETDKFPRHAQIILKSFRFQE